MCQAFFLLFFCFFFGFFLLLPGPRRFFASFCVSFFSSRCSPASALPPRSCSPVRVALFFAVGAAVFFSPPSFPPRLVVWSVVVLPACASGYLYNNGTLVLTATLDSRNNTMDGGEHRLSRPVRHRSAVTKA
jgi:hypothetical protein